ncbi:membrane protein insertion efficiency factor YidD [Candidatus Uhrbacteria bacterium]|nr:membrane protein insertion efficiency factor YidD [Candidatus Uhrbacteria bacterium]
MKWVLMALIRGYQTTLSPDHGLMKPLFPQGFCRFYPSCSEYGHVCIARHGVFKGAFLSAWRIVRCNPLSVGGVDEPPTKNK